MVANDENGQLIYDRTGIGTLKDNINTSIGMKNTSVGMKKMPVLVLARLAEIKITGTGITFMTVLVFNNIKMPVLESPEQAFLEIGCHYRYWH